MNHINVRPDSVTSFWRSGAIAPDDGSEFGYLVFCLGLLLLSKKLGLGNFSAKGFRVLPSTRVEAGSLSFDVLTHLFLQLTLFLLHKELISLFELTFVLR